MEGAGEGKSQSEYTVLKIFNKKIRKEKTKQQQILQ